MPWVRLCCYTCAEREYFSGKAAALTLANMGNDTNSTKVLVSAATSTVFAYVLSGQDFNVNNIAQLALTVGAPTIMGQMIVNVVDGGKTATEPLFRAVAGGGIAVVLMIAAGALPAVVDTETLMLVGTVSAGIYVGELIG